jgi:exodeoxyribonuclease VII small subunit
MTKNPPSAPPPPLPESFEDALHELERIVEQLESGEKPLEDSLALYERGVAVLKHGHEILNHAERRIRLLVRDENGKIELKAADEETLDSSKNDFDSSKTEERRSKPSRRPPAFDEQNTLLAENHSEDALT